MKAIAVLLLLVQIVAQATAFNLFGLFGDSVDTANTPVVTIVQTSSSTGKSSITTNLAHPVSNVCYTIRCGIDNSVISVEWNHIVSTGVWVLGHAAIGFYDQSDCSGERVETLAVAATDDSEEFNNTAYDIQAFMILETSLTRIDNYENVCA